ncbi:MAG: hypothetical protein N2254_09800 [bacterium]|nr:hypothetical protein [bacterium]
MPDRSANNWNLKDDILSHFIFQAIQGLQDMQQSGDQLQVQQGQQEKVKYKDNTEFKNMSILIKKLAKAIAEEVKKGLKKIDIKTSNGSIKGTIDIQTGNITITVTNLSLSGSVSVTTGTGTFPALPPPAGPGIYVGPFTMNGSFSGQGTATISAQNGSVSGRETINIQNIKVENQFDF